MKIKVLVSNGFIRIYINDVPHLFIKQDELVGFQSWIVGEGETIKYIIEYTTKSGEILCEYDTPKKWKTLLRLLDKTILIKQY